MTNVIYHTLHLHLPIKQVTIDIKYTPLDHRNPQETGSQLFSDTGAQLYESETEIRALY